MGRAAGDDRRPGGAAAADRLRRARPVPDGGVRDRAGVRHPAGVRAREVRAGRDRRRPDAVDGRPAAPGRARRPQPRQGADLHRRAVRRGDAEGVGRRQPRLGAPTRSRPSRARSPRRSPTARRARTPRPSGSSGSPRSAARGRRTGSSPRSPGRCSTPPTCRTPSGRSWPTGRARRPTRDAERDATARRPGGCWCGRCARRRGRSPPRGPRPRSRGRRSSPTPRATSATATSTSRASRSSARATAACRRR